MTIRARVQELEKQLEELKQEILKQDKKEHKSLSDYRIYEYLGYGEEYKYISFYNKIEKTSWYDTNGDNFDEIQVKKGNVYSIDTPNELLEREIKKHQLWFALEKHLKENNCLAIDRDFTQDNKKKYFITFSRIRKCIEICANFTTKINTIYSTNEDILSNYLNTLSEEDIKIMFDVE